MHQLTGTSGIVAIAAAVVAVIAVILAIISLRALKRLRSAQRVLLAGGQQDLVAHAATLQSAFEGLSDYVQEAAQRLEGRMSTVERRLDGAVAYRSLVRYDAYGEMSGRQSTSIALLDGTRSGIVLSSIHHRDQARLYAKQITNGEAEIRLSPEEEEAIRLALAGSPAGGD